MVSKWFLVFIAYVFFCFGLIAGLAIGQGAGISIEVFYSSNLSMAITLSCLVITFIVLIILSRSAKRLE